VVVTAGRLVPVTAELVPPLNTLTNANDGAAAPPTVDDVE